MVSISFQNCLTCRSLNSWVKKLGCFSTSQWFPLLLVLVYFLSVCFRCSAIFICLQFTTILFYLNAFLCFCFLFIFCLCSKFTVKTFLMSQFISLVRSMHIDCCLNEFWICLYPGWTHSDGVREERQGGRAASLRNPHHETEQRGESDFLPPSLSLFCAAESPP